MEMGLEDKAFWKDYKELEKKKVPKGELGSVGEHFTNNILSIRLWLERKGNKQ